MDSGRIVSLDIPELEQKSNFRFQSTNAFMEMESTAGQSNWPKHNTSNSKKIKSYASIVPKLDYSGYKAKGNLEGYP